jgi:choline dehydrogenase-like flavoprotein
MSLRCQDLVIGSGPAGSITAGLLAEAGHDVLLVEEGAPVRDNAPEPFSLDEMVQCYRYRGLSPSFGKPKVAFVEACCPGGGSEINSALYHRTPPDVLVGWWRDYGLKGASAEEMQPHFAAIEQSIGVRSSPGLLPAPACKLRDGAEALNWKWTEVERWVRYGGGLHPDGSPEAVRTTMMASWLPKVAAAGGRLLTSARVIRLERGGGVWTAAVSGGAAIRADHVFLCGGAVQSPLLLRFSGIRHNIGDSLAMHPSIKVVAVFPDEVNYPGLGVPFVQVKEFAPRLTFGSSVSSRPHLALAMLDHPHDSRRVLERWRNAAVYYVALSGPATGSVRRLPVTGDPLVRYQLEARDLRDLADGMRSLCRLLFEAGAVELFPALPCDGPLRTPDDLRRLPASVSRSRTNLMTIHLFGSCPMGERRERTAVDSWGRVWDVPHLSVHDASILCSAPGVNPQGSIMAMAMRNTLRHLGAG